MDARVAASLAALAMTSLTALPVRAEPVEEFYKSHPVTMILGYSAGGAFDIFARTVANYMGKYIPGHPTLIVQNMPGAGSLLATNYVYNISPKDGTVIAMVRAPVFEPLTGTSASSFDATKFTWIGSGLNELTVCALLGKPEITTFDDATKINFSVAGSGPGSDDDMFTKSLIKLFGLKAKLVSGYPGGNEMTMAVETGEVDGRCGWSWAAIQSTRPEWVTDHRIKVLTTLTATRLPQLPDTPAIMEFAHTDRERQILTLLVSSETLGRPFLAPPGVPADRAAALRKAFEDTMKDPGLVAEMSARKEPPSPTSWQDTEVLIKQLFATPKDVLQEAKAIIAEK